MTKPDKELRSKGGGRGLLFGKACVVSGVGPGLGRQVALLLAQHGAKVLAAARKKDVVASVVDEIQANGGEAYGGSCDICDPSQCARLMDQAKERMGGVDALVNNAFRFDVMSSFEQVDLVAWKKIMDVNLFGSLQLTQAALPFLIERGGGSVVMVASMAARKPQALQGGYGISKGALLSSIRILAEELGPKKIRVNAVVPGWMLGPAVEFYIEMTASNRGVDKQVIREELESRIPLGQIPTDREVAGTVAYLVSDLAAAVTGQAIDANGGEFFS